MSSSSSSLRFCSCSPPGTVDLTDFFFDENLDDADGFGDNKDSQRQHRQQQLQQNFEQYGWSPVEVRVIANAPAHIEIPSLWYKSHQWKKILSSLFTPAATCNASVSSSCTLIRNESGSPRNSEAKISWELLRRHCSSEHETAANSEVFCHLRDWIWIMFRIVQSTCRALGLSSDLLLACSSSTKDIINSTTNMDLLRAFSYDVAVIPGSDNNDDHHPDPSTTPSATSLGSSPHTDWGSWTVIWQDDVGGLQTFCHRHQLYQPVSLQENATSTATAAAATDTVRFIVHVGDVTSLAMSLAYQKRFLNQSKMQPKQSFTQESQEQSWKEEGAMVVWPSPRHRVISPTQQKRHSLVYFAYPSPDSTIREIADRLYDEWKMMMSTKQNGTEEYPRDRQCFRVPYDDYFLLRDQSKSAKYDAGEELIDTELAKRKFDSILTKKLGVVFQEKWQQVQR
jgi:hypothetical protein